MTEVARFGRADTDRPFRPETSANDPREIVIVTGWNVRDMDTTETRNHIDSLKTSIMQRVADGLPGLLKPIEVRYDPATGTKTLVDGQCRLTACRELWDEGHEIFVPNVRVKGDDAQLLASSITGNSGQSLTQWEIGVGCQRLVVGFNWTPEMVAAHICKPIRYVNEAMALAEASPETKELMAAGEVTTGRVLQETKQAKKEHGDKAAKVVGEKLKQEVAAKPKAAKGKKAKPLARSKAASPSDKLLNQARELCEMITDEKQSWDDVMGAAKKLLKALEK